MSSAGDIAIIGMSGMFAGAPDLRTYWQNIVNKVDAVHDAGERWAAPYFDPESVENDRIYTRKGGFLGEFTEFNPVEFGVMPSTVAAGDADHFLALKVARDALNDAGYAERPFNGEKTGIILGRGTYVNRGYNTLLHHGQVIDQTLELLRELVPNIGADVVKDIRSRLKADLPPFTPEVIPSLVPNVITGRIANRLDLLGPNYIVDAACASSLVALEQAIGELRRGRCDMMLAGGVHTTTPPQLYMMFTLLKALSHSTLRAFDAGSDGTLLGEGLGILALKRVADAQRDGDRIYAVIKGVGCASDGRALGLLAPRLEGQLLALERAYGENNVDPDTVGLIEAHGTGMPLGDATEVNTLTRIFGKRDQRLPRRALGSVKSMIGHCIPAAGIAGVIKTTLALYHKVLPPTLCGNVNTNLGLGTSSLYVNNETRPWIHGATNAPRRAGVNAFGFGGINAHAIVEEYVCAETPVAMHAHWPSELLVFSADDVQSLIGELRKLHQLLLQQPGMSLAGLAMTLSGAPHKQCRMAVVCADLAELQRKLELALEKLPNSAADLRLRGVYYSDKTKASEGRAAFLFPGEGGQYTNMLTDLCLYFPQVRSWFDLLDEAFEGLSEDAPSQIVFPAPTCLSDAEQQRVKSELLGLSVGSASVFVASMALHELITAFGVHADAMVGHSTGEGSALIAGGVVRLPTHAQMVDAMRHFAAVYQELGTSNQIPTGALVTVGAVSPELIQTLLVSAQGRLHLALDNCPNQAVLFGEKSDIEIVTARVAAEGGICIPMSFDRAYHTPLFMPLEPRLRALYDRLEVGPGHTPVYSCASMEPFPADAEEIRQLATRQWFSGVRFRETIAKLHAEGTRTFIEVGPGGNLTSFVKDTLKRGEYLAFASNVEGKSGLQQLQQLLAQLYVRGAALDFAPLYRQRTVMPIVFEAAQDAPKRHVPVLDMMMPRMQLDAAALQDVRARIAPAIAAMPGKEVAASAAASVLTTPVTPVIDSQTGFLDSHFALMQDFLNSQARVLGLMTQSSNGNANISPAAPAMPAAASEANAWPLLGEAVLRTDGSLYCERDVDLKRDIFLLDHTLGAPVSARYPQLHPLPVIPFTVSMEIVAEAAARLTGKRVVGMVDLRGSRWLALDQGHLRLAIHASRKADAIDQVHVRIYLLGDAPNNQQLVFEGTARLADAFPAAPLASTFALTGEAKSNYVEAKLYESTPADNARYAPMFHGPCFQGVTGLRRWGREGIEGDFEAVDAKRFFSDIGAPAFQTDSALLDSAGQLIGYWVAERFGADLSFFPFRVLNYEQYAPPLAAGGKLICRARIRVASESGERAGFEFVDRDDRVVARVAEDEVVPASLPAYYRCRLFPSGARLEADFEFIDESGRLWAKVSGWQDQYFSIPHSYYRCRLFPQTEFFSTEQALAVPGVIARRIDPLPPNFLDASWGIWKRVLAHLELGPNERDYWYALPETGPRRGEWLLGRIAAKDAVRLWAQKKYQVSLAPADIEILPDALGKPIVSCPALADLVAGAPQISIGHSLGCTIAVAADPHQGLGIDIERLAERRSFEFLEGVLTPEEKTLINEVAAERKENALLGIWCAKEAASKRRGTGLQGDPRLWRVIGTASGDELTVRHQNDAYRVRLWRSAEEVLALCVEGTEENHQSAESKYEIQGVRKGHGV